MSVTYAYQDSESEQGHIKSEQIHNQSHHVDMLTVAVTKLLDASIVNEACRA